MSKVIQIADKPTHDKIVSESEDTPAVIYVSNSALPACKKFTPQYEELAGQYGRSNGPEQTVRLCQLELTSEVSYFFKFSPNQLPVCVFMGKGPWSKTAMSPSIGEVEMGVAELLEKAGKLKN